MFIELIDPIQLERFYEGAFWQGLMSLLTKVTLSFLVFMVGVQIIKYVRVFMVNALKRSRADRGVIQFLDSLVKAILYLILVFSIAANFGVEATSLVAILGSAGVAIGLALQGSLSNFAGGVLILLLKPFVVGDYIIEDTKGNEGTVTEIQLFYTKLKTPDDRTIILPNGALANTSLTNVTDTNTRRIDLFVGISYDASIQEAKSVIETILWKEPRLIRELEQNIFVEELADSCVVIGIRAFTTNENFKYTKWDLLERIKESLDENNINIPYPQMDVYIKKNNNESV